MAGRDVTINIKVGATNMNDTIVPNTCWLCESWFAFGPNTASNQSLMALRSTICPVQYNYSPQHDSHTLTNVEKNSALQVLGNATTNTGICREGGCLHTLLMTLNNNPLWFRNFRAPVCSSHPHHTTQLSNACSLALSEIHSVRLETQSKINKAFTLGLIIESVESIIM